MVTRRIIVSSEFRTSFRGGGSAEVEVLNRKLKELRKRTRGTNSDFGTLRSGVTRLRIAYFNLAVLLGTVALAFRAIVTPSLELEKAMLGVAKTTGLTNEELEVLKGELNDISNILPVSTLELAEIAKTAGQLGIAKQDISDFTKSIALISTVTDLTASEAATNIAKIANAFNIPISKIALVGNVLNELENTTAATTSGMVKSLTRVGAAATTLGFSFGDTSAALATLISAGFGQERAGTRLRALFTKMAQDTESFAKIAGVSIGEFNRILNEDANDALLLVLEGLNNSRDSATKMKSAFDAAGRVGGFALVTLADNAQSFSTNMGTVNDQLVANNSLIKETAKLLESTSIQMDILKNIVAEDTRVIGDSIKDNMIAPLVEFLINLRTGEQDFDRLGKANQRLMEAFAIGAITAEQFRSIREATDPLLAENEIDKAAFAITELVNQMMSMNQVTEESKTKTEELGNQYLTISEQQQLYNEKIEQLRENYAESDQSQEEFLESLQALKDEYPELLRFLEAQDLLNQANKESTDDLNKSTGNLFDTLSRFEQLQVLTRGGGGRGGAAGAPTGRVAEPGIPGGIESLRERNERLKQEIINYVPRDNAPSIEPSTSTTQSSISSTSISGVNINIQGAGKSSQSIAQEVKQELLTLR